MSATQSWEVWNILVATMHREITQSMMGTWGLGSLGLVFKATAAMLSFHQAEMGEWSREAGGCGWGATDSRSNRSDKLFLNKYFFFCYLPLGQFPETERFFFFFKEIIFTCYGSFMGEKNHRVPHTTIPEAILSLLPSQECCQYFLFKSCLLPPAPCQPLSWTNSKQALTLHGLNETTLVKGTVALLVAVSCRWSLIFILLDLPAVFDTINPVSHLRMFSSLCVQNTTLPCFLVFLPPPSLFPLSLLCWCLRTSPWTTCPSYLHSFPSWSPSVSQFSVIPHRLVALKSSISRPGLSSKPHTHVMRCLTDISMRSRDGLLTLCVQNSSWSSPPNLFLPGFLIFPVAQPQKDGTVIDSFSLCVQAIHWTC